MEIGMRLISGTPDTSEVYLGHTVYNGMVRTKEFEDELRQIAARDINPKLVEMATQTSSTIGTLPTYLIPGFQDLVREYAPFYDLLTKRVATSTTVDYNAETAYPTGSMLAEGTAQSNVTATIVPQSVSIRYGYVQQLISDVASVVRSGVGNLTQEFLRASGLKGLMRLYESQLLTGDGTAPNMLGFDAMFDAAAQTQDNYVDAATATLTLDMIDDAIEGIMSNQFPASGLIAFAPASVMKQLAKLLRPYKTNPGDTYNLPSSWANGISYNGIVFKQHWALEGAASGSRKVYIINPEFMEVHELMPPVTMDLGESQDYDGRLFRHKFYSALVDLSAGDDTNNDGTGPLAHAMIANLA